MTIHPVHVARAAFRDAIGVVLGIALGIALAALPARAQPCGAPDQAQRRVRATLQTRPGGPMEDVDARVRQTPGALPTVAADAVQLEDDELVLGVVVDGKSKAYPIRYLGLHEVINDEIGDVPLVVTWCPLTASGVVFSRRVGERVLTFDFVWGLIHDNLVISDRETGSVWSQLHGKAVSGVLMEQPMQALPTLQTTWGFWRKQHPQTQVMYVSESAGWVYHYFDPETLRTPLPVSTASMRQHDTSSLGVGIRIDGHATFLPLRELAHIDTPLELRLGSSTVTIHYAEAGLTAWATADDGRVVPAVLVYARGWKRFNPESEAFAAVESGR